jgi:hypothetical protein
VNNKGSVQDLLFVIVMFLVICIVAIFMVFIVREFLDDPNINTDHTAPIISNYDANIEPMWERIAVGILFAGVIGTIALAFTIRTHPAFLPVSILYGIVVVTISVPLSNVYDKIQNDPNLASLVAQHFGLASNIMTNLPLYTTGFLVMLLITMYGINKVEGV